MRVLVIKLSSMGDVIHTLPALTDAGQAIPHIEFDWVVEENFQEIPAWHPLVKNIIPIALRRWRKNKFSKTTLQEWREFYKKLRHQQYDLIIDAQGLLKSAIITFLAKGLRAGFSLRSARDPVASLFYQRTIFTPKVKQAHAITRLRHLFSGALGYTLPETVPHYGLNRQLFQTISKDKKYLVFLHGTTWTTKHWPEQYWIELTSIAAEQGYQVKLLWGNTAEQERAQRIATVCSNAIVSPRLPLKEIAAMLASAQGIVSVDTGLGHLAAALDVPTVSLYGPTNAELTGALGQSQKRLQTSYSCSPCLSRHCLRSEPNSVQPPCFSELTPQKVWKALETYL